MAGTITMGGYTFPFDEELFQMYFENEPDLIKDAFVQSGVLVENARIARLIADGSNYYTIPFYGQLADDADNNYDGQTNITLSTMGGATQSGVVYGRAHGWYADDFVADFTAANPLAAIAARVAKYWMNKRQARTMGLVDAVLSLDSMTAHDMTSQYVTPTLLSDKAQEVWGDRKGLASLAVMHSAIAQKFEDLERVEYRTYTDPNGIQRALPIYEVNGITAILDDGVTKKTVYTTANAFTATVGGTVASGDKITVAGVEVTLDATSGASKNAAAGAVRTAVAADATASAAYTVTGSNANIILTQKEGHYNDAAPTASITSTAGTIEIEKTTNGTNHMEYATYLFAPGALHHASAPVARPVFRGRDELTRGGTEFFGNRFRETIHPNGFSYTLGVGVISPTDAQLLDATKWQLAYSDHRMIPFARIVSPAAVQS